MHAYIQSLCIYTCIYMCVYIETVFSRPCFRLTSAFKASSRLANTAKEIGANCWRKI